MEKVNQLPELSLQKSTKGQTIKVFGEKKENTSNTEILLKQYSDYKEELSEKAKKRSNLIFAKKK